MTSDQERRLSRLRRIAKDIATSDHWQRILESFPEEDRDAIKAEIEPLLTFK